ncbi:MAG: Adenylate kinase [Candidatus Bipolaricaulis sibiricus]|uniref:Adenylate kinase n=1 Tax=Bipolaricaulis sibiricus TaxID=2501609 RepID=A0A410FV42_BIPS1|nr:MAG: Adenylate kinase [Candidatus Bipolaricaulis sibiricus]
MKSDLSPMPGQRINVVGTSGSGKTTVGRAIADRLGIPFVELDALAWLPAWTNRPLAELQELVDERTRGPAWVVDGNRSEVRDLVWGRADTVVWLDYPFRRVFGQLLKRTLRRALRREELWNGNRESLRMSFFSRESILLWAVRTHRWRKREYPALLGRPEHAHLRVIRLRSPVETRRWLDGLTALVGPSPSRDRTA